MRVLLDTNVIIPAILFGGIPRDLVESGLRGDLELVTGPFLLAELKDVLVSKFRFSETVAAAVRSELENLCSMVEPVELDPVLPDPADMAVLSTALAGKVDAIVTEDKELRALQVFESIAILSPREMAERLRPGM